MTENAKHDEPVFIVKLAGFWTNSDKEKIERKLKDELPGHVVAIDARVEDIYKMTRLDVERLGMRIEEVMGK